MAYDEQYREKLFYEQTLTKLNERALKARIFGHEELYHEVIMAMYDYLIPSVKKIVTSRVEYLLQEMQEKINKKYRTSVSNEPLMVLQFESWRKKIVFDYSKWIHVLIVETLDKKNLMLKRKDLQLGYEDKDKGK